MRHRPWLLFLLLAFCLGLARPAFSAPRIIDSIGSAETDIRVNTFPGPPVITWAPHATFFVEFADHEQGDVVLVDWREGKRSLGKPFPCAAASFVKTVQANPTTPAVAANVGRFDCRLDKASAIAKAGSFALHLTYKQTLAGKTHALGTLTFKVNEHLQGAQNKPHKTYAEDRDHQIALATIEEHASDSSKSDRELQDALSVHHRIEADEPHEVVIRFWTKYDKKGPHTLTMTCMLGDKKVADARNDSGGGQRSFWTFKGKEQLHINYVQQGFRFYNMQTGKKKHDTDTAHHLGDNPGAYRCVAMAEGEIVKEVDFTVGADGEIAPNPCREQATLLRQVNVLGSKDLKVSNIARDASAGARSAFFGRVALKSGCPPRPLAQQ